MQCLFYVKFLLLAQLTILVSFFAKICHNSSVSFAISVLLSLGYHIVSREQQNKFSLNWALGSSTKTHWRFIILVRNQTWVTDKT